MTNKKIAFWLLQITWGLVMNVIGLLAAVAMMITGHKPKVFRDMIYFEVGKTYWGGFNLGFVAIVHRNPPSLLLKHEYGHFIQNAIYGVFCPFLIDIPSAVRYHYRNLIYKIAPEKYFKMPKYYDAWFEKQADKFGDYGGNK